MCSECEFRVRIFIAGADLNGTGYQRLWYLVPPLLPVVYFTCNRPLVDILPSYTQVKRIAAAQLKTSAANVMLTEKAAQLACEDGYTFTVVNGSGTTKERSKCGKHQLDASHCEKVSLKYLK